MSLHDSWSFPVIREVPTGPEKVESPAPTTASRLPRDEKKESDRSTAAHVA
jgi:hypothetical protein